MTNTDLREKFEALRAFVETIPAENLDMRTYEEKLGCRCVIGHGSGSAAYDLEDTFSNQEWCDLFWDRLPDIETVPYPIPTGQPAKDEFLRRLDVLKTKYCGAP